MLWSMNLFSQCLLSYKLHVGCWEAWLIVVNLELLKAGKLRVDDLMMIVDSQSVEPVVGLAFDRSWKWNLCRNGNVVIVKHKRHKIIKLCPNIIRIWNKKINIYCPKNKYSLPILLKNLFLKCLSFTFHLTWGFLLHRWPGNAYLNHFN